MVGTRSLENCAVVKDSGETEERTLNRDKQMETISLNTLQRLILFYAIGQFRDGVFGSVRLQKVMFMALRGKGFAYKPFKYSNWYYGAYSEELQTSLEHLLSIGYVSAFDLVSRNNTGNKFIIANKEEYQYFELVLSHVDRKIMAALKDTIALHGYRQIDELIVETKSTPEFVRSDYGDTIWENNAPPQIKIDLPSTDVEDLELALNPSFVSAMTLIGTGLENAQINIEKVKRLAKRL